MTAQSNPSLLPTPSRQPAAVAAAGCPSPPSPWPRRLTGAAATQRRRPVRSAVGGWHGHGFMRGPLTPGQIEDRVDRGIRHAAIELDATPEQQDKLRTIAKGAVKDLRADAREGAGRTERAAELLTQPTVDRGGHRGVPRRAAGAGRTGEQALRPGGGRRGRGADARAAQQGPTSMAAMAPQPTGAAGIAANHRLASRHVGVEGRTWCAQTWLPTPTARGDPLASHPARLPPYARMPP